MEVAVVASECDRAGARAALARAAGVPQADIEIRIAEGHEGEMLADLHVQAL
ncbi:hypothetical protein [Nocardia sp. NPDC057440]|uniref:hypothetical protein n=1 Tax=Nocardia sp. NPDC057440 TaxID=3346134 RepID=UPI003673387E